MIATSNESMASSWVAGDIHLTDETKARLDELQSEDLSFLEEQLCWKDNYSPELAHEAVEEYRKWLAIQIAVSDPLFSLSYFDGREHRPGMPSRHVDAAWHRHILFTREYRDCCERIAGRMIHHRPCTRQNVTSMDSSSSLRAYTILFGEIPEIWHERERFLKVPTSMCDGEGTGCETIRT